jgi:hypothetical protein
MTGSAKFLLMSILVMSILIPARAASHPNPELGLRRALWQMAIFDLIYVLAIWVVYPRLL